jgi:tetratricopeptide (TPR) repeat protein
MDKITEIDQLLIEKYLDKTLTGNELATFNQRLTDATFAAEVQRYEKAVEAINIFGDNKLKALLQEEENKLNNNNSINLNDNSLINLNNNSTNLKDNLSIDSDNNLIKNSENKTKIIKLETPQYRAPKMVSLGRKWALAAGLLMLVSAATWYFLINETPKTDSIYASNFRPYPNYGHPIVREDVHKNDLDKAFAFYENGNYKEAITYFEKTNTPLKTGDTPQYNALFYQANAYLAINETEKAVKIFEQINATNDPDWQPKAEWYLALALSKTQKDKAKLLFEKIKNTPNHQFQKQAAAVLAR